MFGQLASTFILLGSIASYKPQINLPSVETEKAEVLTNYNLISGSYCLNSDGFHDFAALRDSLEDDPEDGYQGFDNFASGSASFCATPVYLQDNDKDYFLTGFGFQVYQTSVQIYLHLYDMYRQTYDFNFGIDTGDDLSDVTYPSLIISFNQSQYFNNDFQKVFTQLFSHESNSYVQAYSGYYNFISSSLTSDTIYFAGSIVFGNSLWVKMSNHSTGGGSGLRFWYYDTENLTYDAYNYYTYPFDDTSLGTTSNLYLQGLMPNSSYNYMSQVGVFSYIRQSDYDNTTFSDLLFTIMDTPVYFISRFLSFELFGVNMFVAFTGLLTVCVILVLIKRFF